MVDYIDAIIHCSDYSGLLVDGPAAFPDYIANRNGKVVFKFTIAPLLIKNNEAMALIRCNKETLLGNGDDISPLFDGAPMLSVLSWGKKSGEDDCPFDKLSGDELVIYQNIWPHTNPFKFGEFARKMIPKNRKI